MRLSLFVVLFAFCLPAIISAEAEDSVEAPRERSPLALTQTPLSAGGKSNVLRLHSGQTPSQIEKLFGKPSSIESRKEDRSESWYYGASMIFFQEGKVTAWTDAGELSLREKLTSASRNLERQTAEQSWTKPWEAPKSVESEEVVDEIIFGRE